MNFNDRSLKIFFSYYKPHLKLFILDMICAVFISLIDIVFPMLSRYAVNTVIPNKNLRLFVILSVFMLIAYVLRRLCNWFVCYWGHVFGNRVEADMRHDIFEHLEKQSFSFFDQNRTGKLMSRATTDLFEVTELAHHGPEDVFTSFLTLTGSFILLLKIRWELAVVVFIFLPVMIFVTMRSRKNLTSTSKRVKEKTSEINALLESSISGIRVTKGFTNEAYELSRFDESNKVFKESKKENYKYLASFHANIEFNTNILNLIVLVLGGFFIMKGRMDIADLVAANLFVAAFTQPVRKLANFIEQYTTGMAGFSRFLEIMRTDTQIHDSEDAVEILASRGNISFENVDFSYNENYPVLKDISLNIKSGEKFALVGSSGGGKTTLCSLIPRFYEINRGKITLDGIDLQKIKIDSLRKQIGIVQQDVFLFAGSVFENIAYGKTNASMEEVIQAAKRAEIHEDIMKMPDGYNTIVGERGIKLSGGQKQRVSIARCFLKNPPILILDEATSALDTATEIKIQHAFDELSKGRTTLVIAHRLSTIKNSSKIAVVDEKGIAEIGTHEELFSRKGEYYKLCMAQFSHEDMKD